MTAERAQQARYCACGTRLARDNRSTRCGACARRDGDRHISPPAVPASFWQSPEMVEALGEWHIGHVIRAYRLHEFHGQLIPQEVVTRWFSMTQAQLSRIENGPPITDLAKLIPKAHTLGIPAELLWFKLPGNKRAERTYSGILTGRKPAAPHVQVSDAAEDETKRRQMNKLLGLGMASVVNWPSLREMTQLFQSGHGQLNERSSGRLSGSLLASHIEIANALARLYRHATPDTVLPMAMTYAAQLVPLLDAPMQDGHRLTLASIIAGVHSQIGLWSCHSHQPGLAYRYLSAARSIAENFGDPILEAQTLGAFSYYFSSAPRGGHGGNPEQAIRLLSKALSLAIGNASLSGGTPTNFTIGWLATWRADQYATLGWLNEAQRDVDLAQRGLSANDDAGSASVGFFARPVCGYGMREHCGSVQALTELLSHNEQATQTFDHVDAQAANMRRRIATLGHQALGHRNLGELEQACANLSQAAHLAVEQHYTMGFERAMGVRAGFDHAWIDVPRVRELDEQLVGLRASLSGNST